MNFEPLCCSNLEDQKRPMHRFFEKKKKKKKKKLNTKNVTCFIKKLQNKVFRKKKYSQFKPLCCCNFM